MSEAYVERLRTFRLDAYTWRVESNVATKVMLAVVVACITGVLAQVRVPLPFSPVPLTGQTFAVLAAGIMLGRYYGGLSQLIYIVLGVAGIPWFNGGVAGVAALAGPTGGYLIGFVFAALLVGYIADTYASSRRFLPLLGVMMLANFGVIYAFGVLQLSIYMTAIRGVPTSIMSAIKVGALPFIPGDIIKAVMAASLAAGVLPKERLSGK